MSACVCTLMLEKRELSMIQHHTVMVLVKAPGVFYFSLCFLNYFSLCECVPGLPSRPSPGPSLLIASATTPASHHLISPAVPQRDTTSCLPAGCSCSVLPSICLSVIASQSCAAPSHFHCSDVRLLLTSHSSSSN